MVLQLQTVSLLLVEPRTRMTAPRHGTSEHMAERRMHDELLLVSRHRTEILAKSLADARDLKPSSEGTQLNGPSRQWQIAGRSLPLGQMLKSSVSTARTHLPRARRASLHFRNHFPSGEKR